ncbi:MAG: hypothetical protein HS116_06160 [Planctomycetes bacterium]|nr:hypothetical protein [Planctomycetota bacterium]
MSRLAFACLCLRAWLWTAPLALLVLTSQYGCGRSNSDSANRTFEQYFGNRRQEETTEKSESPGRLKLKLRLTYVEDDHLPKLDRQGRELFQKTLADWIARGSHRPVEFEPSSIQGVETFFSKHKSAVQVARTDEKHNLRFDPEGKDGLEVVKEILRSSSLSDMRELYPDAPAALVDLDSWARYVQADLSAKYAAIIKSYPPHPALKNEKLTEFNRPDVWRALAQAEKSDVIVTNVFIAGPERGMDVDRLRRGSLIVGLWAPTPKETELGATLVFSVQPMLCEVPFTLDLPAMQRPVVAGACAWLFFQSRWEGASAVVNPLGKAVSMLQQSWLYGQSREKE